MHAERLAAIGHPRRRLALGVAGADLAERVPHHFGRARGGRLEHRDLVGVDDRALARLRVQQHRAAIAHRVTPDDAAQRRQIGGGDKGRHGPLRLVPFLGLEIFPAADAHPVPAPQPAVAQHVGQPRREGAILAWQAHRLGEPHGEPGQRRDARIGHAFVAGDQHAPRARAEQQQRFLEPRLEPGEKHHVREMLAIRVDTEPVDAGRRQRRIAAGDIAFGGQGARFGDGAEIGNVDLSKCDRHG